MMYLSLCVLLVATNQAFLTLGFQHGGISSFGARSGNKHLMMSAAADLKPLKELLEENKDHPHNNIPSTVIAKIGKNLHNQENHPLNTIKNIIVDYFNSNPDSLAGNPQFKLYDDLEPVATLQANFDDLRIGPDHPSRALTDTYYVNDGLVLRTHTSAHQSEHLREGLDEFLCCGDVYRRDEVDRTHYPVFHQLEGVRVWRRSEIEGDALEFVTNDLKEGLSGLARALFGDCEMRWAEDYFPFTDPSFELEVLYNDKWLEVLAAGDPPGGPDQRRPQPRGRRDRVGVRAGPGAAGHDPLRHPRHPPVLVRGRALPQAVQGEGDQKVQVLLKVPALPEGRFLLAG
ncbi:unnamed protein product [Heterosigma akashiwo]